MINIKRAFLPIIFFCGMVVSASAANFNEEWTTMRFGRIHPHPGYWSTEAEALQAFMPSGVGYQVFRVGDYSILHNHGLYWSDPDNPDTTHDMHASVIVFKDNERVFVARGYRYDHFQTNNNKSLFSFEHWSGVMGDDQITIYSFSIEAGALKVKTDTKSTKDL